MAQSTTGRNRPQLTYLTDIYRVENVYSKCKDVLVSVGRLLNMCLTEYTANDDK